MIARIFILIVLALVLPDLYIYAYYVSRYTRSLWKRIVWWIPGTSLLVYTVYLTMLPNFVPDDISLLNVYLLLMGMLAIPKVVFALFSLVGRLCSRCFHWKYNVGNVMFVLVSIPLYYILFYGVTRGIRRLDVKHVTLYFNDLPAQFDGYRIVQFSDAHVGTFTGSRKSILQRDVDSINSQNPDMIVFTGDIQNVKPKEIASVETILKSLKAPDGVVSVLGNHDYGQYLDGDSIEKDRNERETIRKERELGWKLLRNESYILRRGSDSLVIVGEENDGLPPFPSKANMKKSLKGISHQSFVILLQHDPSAWRRSILPRTKVQLTLSGHTHGGQISLFGYRPTKWITKEDLGLYRFHNRFLYVSAGIGGVVPFRFGSWPEITVITLRKKHNL